MTKDKKKMLNLKKDKTEERFELLFYCILVYINTIFFKQFSFVNRLNLKGWKVN